MGMPRISESRHQEVMVKIGLDPSEMEIPAEKAAAYIEALTQQTTRANTTMKQGAAEVTSLTDKLSTTLGRTVTRASPFAMMSTEVSSLAVGLTGLTGAGRLFQTGMLAAQTTLSSFLGPIGLAAVAVGGLAAAFLLKEKQVEQTTDALHANITALTTLAKSGDEIARGLSLKELKKAEEELKTLREETAKGIYVELRMGKFPGKEAIKWLPSAEIEEEVTRRLADQINKVNKLREAYDDLGLSEEKTVRETLGNRLKWEAEHDETRLEAYRNFLRQELSETSKWGQDYVRLLKDIQDIELKIRVRDFQLPEGIGQMAWGWARAKEIQQEEAEARKQAAKEQEKAAREYAQDQKQLARQAEQDLIRYQNAIGGYVSQMSGAFISAFSGVEDRWQQMLENMLASLLQSGLTALIMGLIFPEVGAGGFLQRMTGLQLQTGTPFVRETGWYQLHRGERVISAEENVTNIRTTTGGSTTQNIFLVTLDWDQLTKKRIGPYLERLSRTGESRILTG